MALLGRVVVLGLILAGGASASELAERARRFLIDLLRIDTTRQETPAARYICAELEREGIACELLGQDPARLNALARLPGSGARRPLLLMAHTDVVEADARQWTVPPFSAEMRDGFIYGRGAVDDKSLLAAEMAVLVELKRRGAALRRDVILMAEADEEAGSTGIQWLLGNAWPKIDAEFALNEGGFILPTASRRRLYHIQTAEKVASRVLLRTRGTAGHGSLPRPDNPVVRLARAVVRLAEADQPVRLNPTTRRYLNALAALEEYGWLAPLLPRLGNPQAALAAANLIRDRDAELDAQLRTSVSPTVLRAGGEVNVIPNVAEAHVDVRRLPNETREEVLARLRRTMQDPAVELVSIHETPPAEPSSSSTALYRAMERAFAPGVVVPYMQRGATDGAFLRARGMAVYGVPLFVREDGGSRAHGNDERIALANFIAGTELLLKIVRAAVE